MATNRGGRALRVYLADLSHTGLRVATEAFPLNVGLIAAYAKTRFGPSLDIRLFKYPERLLDAIKRDPPDVLGCSNYTWNTNLATFVTRIAKAINRETLTVFGGTNYPFDREEQRAFLAEYPSVDVHVFYEGEVAFTHLLRRRLEVERFGELFEAPIDGCHFLAPGSGELVVGRPVDRIKDLDEIPSPYVSGVLDEFFDGTLTPLMETTRGCPFTCNFCNAGDAYFTKVNKFSVDYVREEIEYIAPRAARQGITHLTLADNNFGMIPRDGEIAEMFARAREKHNWPLQMTAWTGKNSKERVIAATEALGPTLSINMSVQSMDAGVLANIKRQNIDLAAYRAINEALTRQGRPQEAELIVPLPGETLETYFQGVERLMACDVRRITSYTLQLLYGTPHKQKAYRERYGYVARWRVVPLDFGTYDGQRIFDTEEVSVSSKTMSFEDYLTIRAYTLTIELCYNDYTFLELRKYLRENGVSLYEWTRRLSRGLSEAPVEIRGIFRGFLAETRSELWDSREALEAHYSRDANYRKLLMGEQGGNVLFKYKGLVFVACMPTWIEYMFAMSRPMLEEKTLHRPDGEITGELGALERYVRNKLRGVLAPQGPTEDLQEAFDYDVLGWLRDAAGTPLSAFRVGRPDVYRFFFSELQLYERRDAFARYGTDTPGLVKTLQRAAGLHRLFRRIERVPA